MPRTTAELVEGVIEVDEDIVLTPFIKVANALVTEICAPVLKADGVTPFHTEDRLTDIETWLAAHFYAVRDPRLIVDQIGLIRAHFESKVDMGLDNTRYGIAAKTIDTSGALAAYDNSLEVIRSSTLPIGGKPRVIWLGKDDD